MKDNLIFLEWDSEFFGFPVSKLKAEHIGVEDLKCIFLNSEARLIYFFTDNFLSEEVLNNNYFDVKLVDTKISIRKTLKLDAKLHPKVEIYESKEIEPELFQLAYRAGLHSRFFKDDFIPKSKYKELYELWLTKSIKRILADIVLVYRSNSKIVGFTTISTKEDEPHVTLLAVNPCFEGKWVSFALMSSIENVLLKKGFNSVWSETQEDNMKAISAYRRHGVEIGSMRYVYHLWRNNY